jgi:erythromycin esterase
VVLMASAGTSLARQSPVDSLRSVWLEPRIVNLDDMIDGGEAPSKLSEAVHSAAIVAFGEATHGDGTGFTVRNALTRALHESLGFDVLALEATGYHKVDEPADPRRPASDVVDSMEARLWRSSAQARPGLIYAVETSASKRPLRIRGFDVQHGPDDAKDLFDEVESSLRAADLLGPDWSVVRTTLTRALRNPFAPVADSTRELVTRRARELVDDLRPSRPQAAILLETALANALVPWTRSMEPRDRQMGKLVVHMATAEMPDERMIMWAASSHVVRSLPAIQRMDASWSYDESLSMGEIIADSMGAGYYVVAISACRGSYGASYLGLSEETIPAPEDGSLEALICAAPFEKAAFLDLRGTSSEPGGRWLSSPLLARPLGYTFMRASWPLVLDGLIVVREMEPSIPYTP